MVFLHVENHVGKLIHDEQDPMSRFPSLRKKGVPVFLPVAMPIRVLLSKSELELRNADFFDLFEDIAYKA